MDAKFHVPFDTAILLRKKGYNNKVDYYYLPNGEICLAVITEVSNDTLDYENNGTIAAPTYHEVLDWLQGNGVRIYAEYCEQWAGFIDNGETKEVETTAIYPTREEAINECILKALEKL